MRLGDRAGQRALDRQDAEVGFVTCHGFRDCREIGQRYQFRLVIREEAIAGCGAVCALAPRICDSNSHE